VRGFKEYVDRDSIETHYDVLQMLALTDQKSEAAQYLKSLIHEEEMSKDRDEGLLTNMHTTLNELETHGEVHVQSPLLATSKYSYDFAQ
jgi:hypothetical protein